MGWCPLGITANRLRGKIDPTALVGSPLEAPLDGRHQAGVLVGDDQLDAFESPGTQLAQEVSPEGLVLRVPDVDAQDLPVPGGRHPGGDHYRFGGHLVVLSDVEERGVQIHVGKGHVVESSLPERVDHLVQSGTDPGHLGPADTRRHPEGGHQLVDGPGGHPVHIGLHHHGVEGLVDPSAGLQDGGEEASLPKLGDGQLHVPGLGGEHPSTVPVALVAASVGPLIAVRPDLGGELDLDQLLADQSSCFFDEVEAFTGSERVE